MPRDRERWRKGKRVGDKRLLFTHIHLRSSAKKGGQLVEPIGGFSRFFRNVNTILDSFNSYIIYRIYTVCTRFIFDLFIYF